MNILFLNSSKEWGGNEKWTVNVACGLAERGHTIYFGLRSSVIRDRIWSKKVSVITFPFANNLDFFTSIRILSVLYRHAIDYVVPTKQREYVLAGLAGKFRKKTKTVFRFGIERPLHNFRNRFAFCSLADLVIVNSLRVVNALKQTSCFDSNKCRLLHNGVELPSDTNQLRDEYRSMLDVGPETTMILVVGRLARQKRIDLAIEMGKVLVEKGCSVKLVVVGSGGAMDTYRNLIQALDMDKHVVLAGHRDDIQGFYQAADIFWLTSRSEGMSNAMLEAMAHALPVVAFDIAGVSEVLKNGHNGMVVPFGKTKEFVQSSLKLIENRGLGKDIGARACEAIQSDFSLERMYENLESLLMSEHV
ncbi:MAG: glycosyltransferase [Chitinivibrionales bacterium]|nr:glycosyltransferase [Chitinivibrionales bacterium]